MNYLIVFILCNAKLVLSANTKTDPRKGKLFTFNSEKEDLEVGLDFSVPFLKIPMKDKLDGVTGFGLPGLVNGIPRINVNPTAIALGGMILLLTSFITPLLNNEYAVQRRNRSARGSDNDDLQNIAQRMLEFSGGCPQRIACWVSQKSGSGDNLRLWKQVIRNQLVSLMINSTSLVEAYSNGQNGSNCESYSPCPIKEESLPKLINSFNILRKYSSQNYT